MEQIKELLIKEALIQTQLNSMVFDKNSVLTHMKLNREKAEILRLLSFYTEKEIKVEKENLNYLYNKARKEKATIKIITPKKEDNFYFYILYFLLFQEKPLLCDRFTAIAIDLFTDKKNKNKDKLGR